MRIFSMTLGSLVLASGMAMADMDGSASGAIGTDTTKVNPTLLMKQLDANEDGELSQEEASKNTQIAARFTGLDADDDGTLSANELAALPSKPASDAMRPDTGPPMGLGLDEEEDAE